MMRLLFAAAAAVLFGAGVEPAQAQCKCGHAGTAVTTGHPMSTKSGTVPQGLSVQHHATASAQTVGCVACPSSNGAAAPLTSAKAGCPHCAASQAVATTTPDGKSDKEVTLTGTMMCAKCGLNEPGVKKCTNALQVKDGDKTITYLLEDKGSGEEYHEGLCGGGTKTGVKVTGTVTEKDGKRFVKATKVEEKK